MVLMIIKKWNGNTNRLEFDHDRQTFHYIPNFFTYEAT